MGGDGRTVWLLYGRPDAAYYHDQCPSIAQRHRGGDDCCCKLLDRPWRQS